MSITTPIKKLNDVVAGLLKSQSFSASLGSVSNDTVWSQAVPNIKNGNTLLIVPGAVDTQVVVKTSAMVMNAGLSGMVRLRVLTDTAISTVTTPPVGARTDGANYFFSAHDPFNETVVLLAGYYNHVYVSHDVSKPEITALGCIATPTNVEPDHGVAVTFLGNGSVVSARQAMTFINATGHATMLQTFPSMVNPIVSVSPDASPTFIGWGKLATSDETNAIQATFTFAAGQGEGPIGEAAIILGGKVVAYLPMSPQLLKDSDVPFVLKWNIMVGEPGTFS